MKIFAWIFLYHRYFQNSQFGTSKTLIDDFCYRQWSVTVCTGSDKPSNILYKILKIRFFVYNIFSYLYIIHIYFACG